MKWVNITEDELDQLKDSAAEYAASFWIGLVCGLVIGLAALVVVVLTR